jgi:hypothetical protein
MDAKQVIVIGTGPIPDLPSFDTVRTYPNDLLTAIEEYASQVDRTLFYIYPGQLAPWSEIHAAILAGFPVCIPTAAALAQLANNDFITFSYAIFLYPMLRAVIYADSRAELLEPPHSFLKDCIALPSHMYFQMNAYHDFTSEPLMPLHI